MHKENKTKENKMISRYERQCGALLQMCKLLLYLQASCNAPIFGLFSALCRMHDLLISYCMDLIFVYVYLTALSNASISQSQQL